MIRTLRAGLRAANFSSLVTTIVWGCVGCALAISSIDLYLWLSGPSLSTGLSSYHSSAHTAGITFVIAIALGLINAEWKFIPRIIAVCLLALLCLQLANHFSALAPASSAFLHQALPGYTFTHELVALNEIFVFLFLTLSLFGLTFERASTEQSAFILVLSLLGLSISGFALYGYMLGSESAYWWATDLRMMPIGALVNIALGIGLILLTWEHLNASSNDLAHILRGISLISVAILSITVTLAACFAIVPLYESLLGTIYQEVESSVNHKRTEFTHFLSSFNVATESLLIQFQQNVTFQDPTLTAEQKEFAFTHTSNKVLSALPGVAGVRFIRAESSASLFQSDTQTSPEFKVSTAAPYLWVATNIHEEVNFFVELPLKNADNSAGGSLRVSLLPAYIMQLLTHDSSVLLSDGVFYLFFYDPQKEYRALSYRTRSLAFELIPQESVPSLLARTSSIENISEELSARRLLRAENLEFLLPLGNSQMQLGFVTKVSHLRTLLFKKLVRIIAGLSVIVLISAGLILLLLQKLGHQVIQLESKLLISFKQLGEELALRKRAQADAEKSLLEKEVLLKEIHHRVKNNLQVISSIINLQLRRISVPEIGVTLQESSDRIQSIALLHETLYRSDDITNIPLIDYITELTRYLLGSYQAEKRVTIQVETNNLSLEIDKAIPLGLILTELLTNSFKYAFPRDRSVGPAAAIYIETAPLQTQEMALIYRDNGIGLPHNFSFENATSLGSRLIVSLCQQLKGAIIVTPPSMNSGIEIKIIFPCSVKTKKETYYEQTAHTHS